MHSIIDFTLGAESPSEPSRSIEPNTSDSSELSNQNDTENSNALQAGSLTTINLSFNDELSKYIEIFPATVNNQSFRFVRCKVCIANPTVVQMYCEKKECQQLQLKKGHYTEH